MRNRSNRRTGAALLSVMIALACRSAPAPATRPPDPAPGAGLPRAEGDPSRRFFAAWQRNGAGDRDGALEALAALDAAGWAIPLDPRDWPGLAGRPELEALAARIAARAPATPHAAVALELPERGLVPEGIAIDPATGAVLVGSIRQRKIVRVARDGAVTDLVPTGAGGLLAPLGLKVDAARGLLWAAAMTSEGMVAYAPEQKGRGGLFAFDLATGALRRSVLTTDGEHLLNDVALAEDGTVYVTDSAAGAVHRLAPGADALAPVVPGGLFYPNGLVLLGSTLVVCDAFGMTLVPVGDAGGAPRPLRPPAGFPLGGIDGLVLQDAHPGRGPAGGGAEPRAALVGIQNGLGTARIVRLELDLARAEVVRAEVLEHGNPRWHVPTTGAVVDGALWYVGNSHVDGISASGLTPEAAAAPTEILRLPLPAR